MIRPKRIDATPSAPSSPAGSYDPGGPVGRMQDDLARHLEQGIVREMAVAHGYGADARGAGERVVHAASAASGYVALLAGYAGAFLLFWR